METLNEIIKAFLQAKKENSLNCSDDTILDCSTRVFNSQRAMLSNKRQVPFTEDQTPEKASAAQINLLYKLNADFDAETITKREAYNLIKRLKGVK